MIIFDIIWNDVRKIVLGDSTDFTLFHDGSVGNIIDCRNAKPFFVVNDSGGGNETMIKATPNDRVELYHNGTIKLWTQSWGAQLAGNFVPNGAVSYTHLTLPTNTPV